jgi:site-specific DNA recombinase
VSQAYIQNQPEKAGAIKRVSATEVEELVARQVRGIFQTPERLVQQLMGEGLSGEAKQSAFSAIARIADRLDDGDEKSIASFSRPVISRVVVDVEAVTITFDRQALNDQLGLVDRESERESAQLLRNGTDREFAMTVPVRLTRFGRQKRMIIEDDQGQQQQVVNDSMLLAVARAMTWDQEIRGGVSLRRIAKRENVSAGYVTRIAPLAFLAPDIVQAIYEGRQPAGLKVKTLSANLPLEWAEQRRVLGFPAR